MEIVENGLGLQFDEKTLIFTFQKGVGEPWKWDKNYAPYLECEEGNLFFADAEEIRHEEYHTGTGKGILSTYRGFEIEGEHVPYQFQTLVWAERAAREIYCEWIPVNEEGLKVKKVFWPGPMEFNEKREETAGRSRDMTTVIRIMDRPVKRQGAGKE